jgi:hypothetical protein
MQMLASLETLSDRGENRPFVFATSDIFVSACTLPKYALFPSGVALIVSSPGLQFAGHTSPYLSVN